jgi:hypothetical protein
VKFRPVRAGGWLGSPRLWFSVQAPCGHRVGLDGGGLSVTPTESCDLSPFGSLASGPDLEGRFLLP